MVIYLIRHGETEATEQRLYCGKTDLPLSNLGQERLKEMLSAGGYPDCDGLYVYTSGMLRTEETLKILYGDIPHEVMPEMREIDFGKFEMKSYEELQADKEYIEWISGDNASNRCPGGESGENMCKRAGIALQKIIDSGKDSLVIAHGGVIAFVMEHFFPEEKKSLYDWKPKPGAGYMLTIDPDTARACHSIIPDPKSQWMGKGYSFFQNKLCEYFPCHATNNPEEFSCMFCFCPLFALGENCGGNFGYTKNGDKDCSGCLFPHMRENYGRIIEKYPRIRELASKKTCSD